MVQKNINTNKNSNVCLTCICVANVHLASEIKIYLECKPDTLISNERFMYFQCFEPKNIIFQKVYLQHIFTWQPLFKI